MRRGDYGYDAPYVLLIFGALSVVTGLGATISWWRGLSHAAIPITLGFVFFLANTSSFLYATRRGKFFEWDQNSGSPLSARRRSGARHGMRPRRRTNGGGPQVDYGPSDRRRHLEHEGSVGQR